MHNNWKNNNAEEKWAQAANEKDNAKFKLCLDFRLKTV